MRKIWGSAFALAAAVGAGNNVWAQEEAGLESEMIVTVQKREQAVIDVPVAVSVLGADRLDLVNITKFDELAEFVPGLQIQEQSPNNPSIVIRGITSDSGSSVDETRVSIFQDGVSITKSRGSYVELFDMERIEIAKGPQPTLFGRGALIGGINLIQAKPDLSAAETSFNAAVGDSDYARFVGVVNAPIIEDVLGVRLAVTHREREGFVENLAAGQVSELNAVQLQAARLSVRFEPTSALSFDLILNTQDDSNTGTSFKTNRFAPQGGDTSPFSAAGLNTFGGFEGGRDLGLERTVRSATLLADWALSDTLTLSSITGVRSFESLEVFDPDGFDYPLLVSAEDAQGDQTSQEFRLNYDSEGPLSWFVGASWMQSNNSWRIPLATDERAALIAFGGLLTAPTPAPFEALNNTPTLTAIMQGFLPSSADPFAAVAVSKLKPAHMEVFQDGDFTESYDVFGEATFAVSDQLELTAGLRYATDKKESDYRAALSNGGSVVGSLIAALTLTDLATDAALAGDLTTAGALGAQAQGIVTALVTPGAPVPGFGVFAQPTNGIARASAEFEALTWRLAARYALSDDINLWASYARGSRPEVLDYETPDAPGGAVVFSEIDAEVVDSYEVGAKSRLLGGALDLEGSLYYYEYSDFQTEIVEGTRLRTINAGEMKAYGFEGAAAYDFSDALELFGTYAYSHARFQTGAYKDNQPRFSPDHTFSIGANWFVPVDMKGALRVTPSYTWKSKTFFDDNNDDPALQESLIPSLQDEAIDEFQDAYGLLNLGITYLDASDAWSVGLFAKNLLDEEYVIDAGNTGDGLGVPTFIRGAPRLVGVELAGRF
jgi:outer membrane receptor protein involved in Fe transport